MDDQSNGTDWEPRIRSNRRGGRPRRVDVTTAEIRAMRERGLSLRSIARQVGAGYGTVRKALEGPISAPCASENPKKEEFMTEAHPEVDPKQALYRDAVEAEQLLKRKYRALCNSDPRAYREILRRARAHVLRMKPGPKPQRNRQIAKAARERGSGAPWAELCRRYIERYDDMTPFTQSLAEDGFRKKVNAYLRDHRRLKLLKKTPDLGPPPEPGSLEVSPN